MILISSIVYGKRKWFLIVLNPLKLNCGKFLRFNLSVSAKKVSFQSFQSNVVSAVATKQGNKFQVFRVSKLSRVLKVSDASNNLYVYNDSKGFNASNALINVNASSVIKVCKVSKVSKVGDLSGKDLSCSNESYRICGLHSKVFSVGTNLQMYPCSPNVYRYKSCNESDKYSRCTRWTVIFIFIFIRKVNQFYTERIVVLSGDVERNPGPVNPANPQVAGQTQGRERGRGQAGRDAGQQEALAPGPIDVSQAHTDAIPRVGEKQKTDLQVVSLNVRGLSDSKKLRHLINASYKLTKASQNSLYLFQEVYVQRLDLLNFLWRGDYYLTPGTGNSQGCLTLLTAPYKIVHSTDLGNRAHVLVLTKDDVNRAELIIANAYAPSGYDADKLTFFEDLIGLISDAVTNYNCENVLLAGDLNLVFSPEEVKNRLYSNPEKRIATAVSVMFRDLNLTDGWNSTQSTHFTWTTSRTGQQSFSTLDRVLYNQANWQLVDKKVDWGFSVSDHAAVIAAFKRVVAQPNRNIMIPRLDPRLLLDPEGRRMLEDKFRELAEQASPDWNPHVKLEYLKMCLRSASNAVTGNIKAKIRDVELNLNQDINRVVEELAEDNLELSRKELLMHKLDDLRMLKRCLIEKIGNKLAQRTARKWYNEGELSNKYFFNLLNRKSNDEITTVFKSDGTLTNDPVEITAAIRNFYKDLYETVPDQINLDDFFFRNIEQVLPDQATLMEEDLSLKDLEDTLSTCTDSSPGPDGIPYSYLKAFWSTLGPAILGSWQYSLRIGELPPSHKLSYLRLIPKAGKDTRNISNLRPITLSNTDHKLLTKTYATKLTKIVESKISQEQTAYIPGRLINDNVRAMLMTVDLANLDEGIDGVLVSLDAKKAFDSVDHRYIRRCLHAFGLSCFIPIFDVLYKDLRSEIICNGMTVEGYKILRGVKQGDALSCILFIICIEPLLRNIKNNQNIARLESRLLPIELPNSYGFADDVSVITKNDVVTVQSVFDEYELFSNNSGLILNADKTELLFFNRNNDHDKELRIMYRGHQYLLRGMASIKINGIIFQQDPTRREEANVRKAIEAMERLLRTWSTRRLTLIGRILILKTFAISKLIFIMQSLMLSENSYKEIVKVLFKFMWNKNFDGAKAPERLRRSIMYTPTKFGGFGMLDVRQLGNSLDLRSYGRLTTSKHPFLKQLRELLIDNDFFNVRIEARVDLKVLNSLKLINAARKGILDWPLELQISNALLCRAIGQTKLRSLVTPNGRRSIAYFAIHTRTPAAKISELTQLEFRSIERFLIYPNLSGFILELLARPPLMADNVGTNELYPMSDKRIVSISTLSSKVLRLNQLKAEEEMICVYKVGMILDPGELMTWTKRTKGLTSTRHKNILLRVAHGDIFSNSRLHRFNLIDSPSCKNCQEPVESIQHRIIECQAAKTAWEKLNSFKERVGLRAQVDLTIENVIGAKDPVNKIELALNAELIHKLTSVSEHPSPERLVRSVIKLISYSEYLSIDLKAAFEREQR